MAGSQGSKGKPRSSGKRKSSIAKYYEMRYPEKKLRRMIHHGVEVSELKKWAADYKAPSGLTAFAILTKLAKEFKLNIAQV